VPNARTYLADNGAFRLTNAAIGQQVTILLVSEVVEDEEALIEYLHERDLIPGAHVALAGAPHEADVETAVDLSLGEKVVTVPLRIAHALWVIQPDTVV
jgi:DtxR family Mn-dependent transcriptional regulator